MSFHLSVRIQFEVYSNAVGEVADAPHLVGAAKRQRPGWRVGAGAEVPAAAAQQHEA